MSNVPPNGRKRRMSVQAAEAKLKMQVDSGELTQGRVTAQWIEKFGVHPCLFASQHRHGEIGGESDAEELDKESHALAEKLLGKLKDHGVYYKHQVQALAMMPDEALNAVLECTAVTHKITEAFDRLSAMERRKNKVRSFFLSLSGSLKSMESMCANYGLAAALVLTMTFANFGAVQEDDWNAYDKQIAIHECQPLIDETCLASTTQRANTHLDYSRPVYCLDALTELHEDPAMNLNGTEMECCIPVIHCVRDATFRVMVAFNIGNGGATAVLLLVVLFTAWLYISLNATKANTDRWSEAKKLSDRLCQEFLFLQIFFIVGMFLAYLGIGATMVLKVSTMGQSWTITLIITFSCLAAPGFAAKCLWEIHQTNTEIDQLRSDGSCQLEEVAHRLAVSKPEKLGETTTAETPMSASEKAAQNRESIAWAEKMGGWEVDSNKDHPGRRIEQKKSGSTKEKSDVAMSRSTGDDTEHDHNAPESQPPRAAAKALDALDA